MPGGLNDPERSDALPIGLGELHGWPDLQCFNAFTFIFPHRKDELRHYAEHVKAFFKARPTSQHSGVISYDSTIRTSHRPSGFNVLIEEKLHQKNDGATMTPAEQGSDAQLSPTAQRFLVSLPLNPQLSADELSCALHSTPLLTSLALHDLTSPRTADVSFLRKMVQFTIDGPVLVPRLQHLSISADRYVWDPTAYIPAWIDMVEGRWRGPPDVVVPRSQLRIVEMRTRSAACWDYDDPHYKVRTACSLHDLERLRALAREGLEMHRLDCFRRWRRDPHSRFGQLARSF
ncbi:hypothetical protein FISHEDRAFT_69408 [Fistulina hepatica ATCC 64428]|uniref:Uncharacterized protein n=1 Tax=Fistulina hepatica ATCC 64428 TaxID=1128425 RepID=A0A0D7AMH5_9AGAR|nr:hypothetical protein FISHEDRAFT_69408 [Fistulina hepatica ATCC 64428]